MAKKVNKKKSFNIPDPKQKLESAIDSLSKYKIGAKGISLHSIKKLKPVFAFDYLSLNQTDLCLNNKTIDKNDLVGFIEGLKKISDFTYERMLFTKPLRFH